MRFGIAWGSIIPDVDLLISIIIIAAGGNMQQALAPHRTLTHSFFTMLVLALIGILLAPPGDQWLLVYAGVGLPFLLLILLLPWLNRRIIYSIPVTSEHHT
jgi:membrane-bound metal-dependent hydrolase YbcI (DUF457 family)